MSEVQDRLNSRDHPHSQKLFSWVPHPRRPAGRDRLPIPTVASDSKVAQKQRGSDGFGGQTHVGLSLRVALGKFLNLSEPQFPLFWIGKVSP